MYIIRIPVYPHIRRYLVAQYGPRIYSGEPNYAALLFNGIFKVPTKNGAVDDSSPVFLGATYDFVISWNNFHARDRAVAFSTRNFKRFNTAIDKLIRQELFKWCEHPNASFKETDHNIRSFLDYYGFSEDELPFLNMKQWYFRERRKQSTRLNPLIDQETQPIFDFSNRVSVSVG
ncbi:MAG: hypothetical protein E6Q66_04725 [Pedobacter sp.]|nr:MAG: hypothetical protein E6Q66_04725 [Pedobacter sp.]